MTNHPSSPHPASPNLDRIAERAALLRQLRSFFDSRGFLEVQPPCLSRDCVVDPYIDPLAVETGQMQLAVEMPAQLYLQTSPEAAMKRMLAAGAPSIYSMGPVFRAGERGELHNLEFTMLEWYDVGADLAAAIALLGELACQTLGSAGYDVIPYRQLFQDFLGFDPIEAPLATIAEQVAQIDRELANSIGQQRDQLLDVLMSHQIQPHLGADRPAIVKNYPLSQAALARRAEDDPNCAARFELFANGIELANGYDELRDAEVLVQRARQCNEKRVAAGRTPLAVESSLVAAMRRGLPACAGVALGVDRLLMVRTGDRSIDRVIPFLIEFA